MKLDMVRIAIVGAGWQGQGLLANLAAIPEAELVGACDLNPQVLEKVRAKYGAEGFTDYTEMFEKTKPDGVLICTHPQVRLPIVAAAAERGVHCFIEKPPARDLESAGQIQAVIEQYGILNSVGFMYRYSPAVTKTRELLRGRRVALVRSCMLDGLAVREGTPAWFFDKSRSGGPVFDQAIHIFDVSRYLLGEIASVSGFQGNLTVPRSETFTVEDSAALVFQYRSGIIQNHAHSWAYSGFKAQLQFISDELDLVLDLGKGTVQGTIGGEAVDFAEEGALYRLELEAFVKAIREGDPTLIRSTYLDSMSSLAFALASVQALESGNVAHLDA
jgi:predicted dehydrogenase